MAKNTKTVASNSKVVASASTQTPDIQAKVAEKIAANTELLEGVKEAFKAVNERDIQVSDNVLSQFLARDKNWDERSDDDNMALLLKLEETAKDVMVADPGISTLVSKMDAEFHRVVETNLDAIRKNKASAVTMLAQFRRLYTLAELNAMPMPGTEAEHVEGTGYRADKVKKNTPQGEPITVVWTNDFVSAMPEGKEADRVIDMVNKETKSPGSTSFKAKTKDELKDLLATATQDRNGLRSMVKRAIKLHHRMIAVQKLNSVSIRWISGDKAKGTAMPIKCGLGTIDPSKVEYVTNGPKPLWMFNTDDPSKGRDFSVTQLLAMQPDKAKLGENGGNMADLIATAGKGADEEETAGTGDGSDMADDEAQATASMFANFIAKTENRTAVLKAIANYKKNANGVDWLEVLNEIDRFVHPIIEKNRNTLAAIANRKMIDNDDAAEETAAA